jgi:hypothetical protein
MLRPNLYSTKYITIMFLEEQNYDLANCSGKDGYYK